MGKVKKDSSGTSTATTTSQNNDGILYTRNLLLRAVAGIYLCAFLTFYYQSPGLFGRNGILPAQNLYNLGKGNTPSIRNPTFVQYHSLLGLDIQYMLEFLSLFGAIVSFIVFTTTRLCVMPLFAVLWATYYSLVEHTQIFEHQSDNLLLEAGFVIMMLAPLTDTRKSSPSDKIGFALLKWVLLRFLFDSGSVKFFSGCPLWWSFQGLKHHFQTMPLPTPLAWWSHHIPTDFMTITTIYTNLTELVLSWFFFFPSRAVRIFLFHWVLYLELTIIFTGNYGFLNFLVSVLLLSLLDDKYLKKRSIFRLLVEVVLYCAAFTAAIYFATGLLHYKQVMFKYEHLGILRSMAKLAPLVAVVAIISTFLTNTISHPSVTSSKGFLRKASNLNSMLVFSLCALSLIGISVVPHHNIDASLNITNTQLGKHYKEINTFRIVNEYGRHLRRMRTERLEINLEYSDHVEGPWKTLPFVFKPWNENVTLPYSGPYLARLDMKFYDAAPSSYRDHLWIMPLAYRILQNQPDVMRLFGLKGALDTAPRYVRGTLYRFAFTPFNRKSKAFWRKTTVGEHFPPVSLSDTLLTTHLRNLRYPMGLETPKIANHSLKDVLDLIRRQLELLEASKAIILISFTGVIINLIHG